MFGVQYLSVIAGQWLRCLEDGENEIKRYQRSSQASVLKQIHSLEHFCS